MCRRYLTFLKKVVHLLKIFWLFYWFYLGFEKWLFRRKMPVIGND